MLTPATDGCHPRQVGRSAGPDRSPLGRAAGSAYGLLMERPPSKKASRELLEKVVEGGSRVVFRLSGTGTSGATLRVYLERYEPETGDLGLAVADALAPIILAAEDLADIKVRSGRSEPDVIT